MPCVAPTTERELLDDLTGTYTLEAIYAAVAAAGLTGRARGDDVVHGATDTRWKRRVRGALQTLKRTGRAHRAGEATWVLRTRGTVPRAILVAVDGTTAQVELRLAAAADLLADVGEPVDLVCVDPPYGLGVGSGTRTDTGARVYARDHARLVPGYVDVDPCAYRDFTATWVAAAAAALRPGGYLAAITGPQQAAWVQVCAEDAGLTYVNSIAVGKVFALRTTRRFAHAHWTVTVMCAGRLDDPRRYFTAPPDLPKARSGVDYPQDLWPVGSVGRRDAAPGHVRYPNALPPALVDRLVGALVPPTQETPVPGLVCDPFVGSGTTALVTVARGLRFIGGDVNPAALAHTAAALSQLLAPRGSADRCDR